MNAGWMRDRYWALLYGVFHFRPPCEENPSHNPHTHTSSSSIQGEINVRVKGLHTRAFLNPGIKMGIFFSSPVKERIANFIKWHGGADFEIKYICASPQKNVCETRAISILNTAKGQCYPILITDDSEDKYSYLYVMNQCSWNHNEYPPRMILQLAVIGNKFTACKKDAMNSF